MAKVNQWPLKKSRKHSLYFHKEGKLSFAPPKDANGYDQYTSDPSRPVPFTESVAIGMTREFTTDDKRFISRRPDVLVYQIEPLKKDVTLAGSLLAKLVVSTSGTDSNWVVKLIDVFPDDAEDFSGIELTQSLAGYQIMVPSEVIRGRFRETYSKPRPFVSNRPTRVTFPL